METRNELIALRQGDKKDVSQLAEEASNNYSSPNCGN
jgi:hypothetical protein